MKKKIFIVFMFLVSTLIFAKQRNDITVLFNPLLEVYDVAYAFSDNTPETFQLIGDIEVQYPLNDYLGIAIVQRLSHDRYFESYSQTTNEIFNKELCVQTEYLFDGGICYLPLKKGFNGPFIYAFPRIGLISITSTSNDADFLLLGGGLNGGYEWLFKSGFALKLYAGFSKTGIITLNNTDNYKIYYRHDLFGLPFDIHLGVRLGFSF